MPPKPAASPGSQSEEYGSLDESDFIPINTLKSCPLRGVQVSDDELQDIQQGYIEKLKQKFEQSSNTLMRNEMINLNPSDIAQCMVEDLTRSLNFLSSSKTIKSSKKNVESVAKPIERERILEDINHEEEIQQSDSISVSTSRMTRKKKSKRTKTHSVSHHPKTDSKTPNNDGVQKKLKNSKSSKRITSKTALQDKHKSKIANSKHMEILRAPVHVLEKQITVNKEILADNFFPDTQEKLELMKNLNFNKDANIRKSVKHFNQQSSILNTGRRLDRPLFTYTNPTIASHIKKVQKPSASIKTPFVVGTSLSATNNMRLLRQEIASKVKVYFSSSVSEDQLNGWNVNNLRALAKNIEKLANGNKKLLEACRSQAVGSPTEEE